MKKNKYIRLIFNRFHFGVVLTVFTSLAIPSCKKFVDVPPPVTSTTTESAFKEDLTATAVLTGIYVRLSNEFNSPNILGASLYSELSADNLTLFDPNAYTNYKSFYEQILEPTYADNGGSYWSNTYSLLYMINTAIEQLNDNSSLTEAVKKRLLGEAYFLRGFCYFYLVNFYGDVPLVLVTDPGKTGSLSRSSASDVYSQIVYDLEKAEGLLTNDYLAGDVKKTTSERVRPNLSSVNALQARVFLYQKNYPAAEAAATKVISQSALYALSSLQNAFLANSSETIWSIPSTTIGNNTNEGVVFLRPTTITNQNPDVYASSHLMESFEPGDERKNRWIGYVTVVSGVNTQIYPYPAKYKVPNVPNSTTIVEYTIVLRLAEQYLIRAEARNEQGNITGAVNDLNAIRTRSRSTPSLSVPNPLPNLSASLTEEQLRPLILHERRVELFTEGGHRWFDLRRYGMINEVLSPIIQSRGGVWNSNKALYPIPAFDIKNNNNLTQNPSYN